MPNDLTQQEWLEHKLSFMGITVGTEAMQAAALIAAWPSSPQGLVVKQLVEAAEAALGAGSDGSGDYIYIASYEAYAKPLLRTALDAARKAGLGT